MYFLILLAVVSLTVFAQLVVKWQVVEAGVFPETAAGKWDYLLHLLVAPWMFAVYVSMFCAGVLWMILMTRMDLSYAFPIYMGLILFLVMILSVVLFDEPMTWQKVVGAILMVAGLATASFGRG